MAGSKWTKPDPQAHEGPSWTGYTHAVRSDNRRPLLLDRILAWGRRGRFTSALIDCPAWVIRPAGEAHADKSESCGHEPSNPPFRRVARRRIRVSSSIWTGHARLASRMQLCGPIESAVA